MAQITKPMCFESHRRSITSVILSGANLSPCHRIREAVTRTYISLLASVPHVAYCSDASDPNGQPTIPLSNTTSSKAVTWKRPSLDPFASQELSLTLTPADIDQNIINDCSVCASVAVCIQHNQRFNSRVRFLLVHLLLVRGCAMFSAHLEPRFIPDSPRFMRSLCFSFLSVNCLQPPVT